MFALILTAALGFAVSPSLATANPSTEPVQGFIHHYGAEVLVTLNNSIGRFYRLSATEPQVQKSLDRLEDGDFLMAKAQLDHEAGRVVVDTIDLVGLRRLIGLWSSTSSAGFINFQSYSDVNIYSLTLPLDLSGFLSDRRQFKYYLVPTQGREWAMMFSDGKKSRLAFMDLENNKASLRVTDPETGRVTEELRLQKLVQ
ncbi:MAG: hypothetical protein KF802_00400 [Bdellovibrionaceae bacterium]|nr:hypothetical protein [Pseudobdellovibrionaceae bacterium]MBX3034724.1 hypothetical protein [Pseudobdellovibrionaceae bacterium]